MTYVYVVRKGEDYEASSIRFICSDREIARQRGFALFDAMLAEHETWCHNPDHAATCCLEHEESEDRIFWHLGYEYVSIGRFILNDTVDAMIRQVDKEISSHESLDNDPAV